MGDEESLREVTEDDDDDDLMFESNGGQSDGEPESDDEPESDEESESDNTSDVSVSESANDHSTSSLDGYPTSSTMEDESPGEDRLFDELTGANRLIDALSDTSTDEADTTLRMDAETPPDDTTQELLGRGHREKRGNPKYFNPDYTHLQ